MSAELDGVRGVWERLGTNDPYWAVLTEDAYHGGNERGAFFQTGREDVRAALDLLDRHHRPYGDVAVDFGCGVGRLSFALAEHVSTVIGIDVAESMIEEAVANNPFPERVRFLHHTSDTLPFADDSVDLVYSMITMQHIPPRLTLRYLLDMVRIVRPGGHLIVQLPSHIAKPTPLPRSRCRAAITVLDGPTRLTAGSAGYLRLSMRNDGDGPWPAGELVNVGDHWWRDGAQVCLDDGRVEVPALAPGATGEVALRVHAPSQPGRYEVELDVVQESVAWWADLGSPTVRHQLDVIAGDDVPTEPGQPVGESAAEPAVTTMQMHGVHHDLVISLFDQLGCTVLEALPDKSAVPWTSYVYVVQVGEYRLELT